MNGHKTGNGVQVGEDDARQERNGEEPVQSEKETDGHVDVSLDSPTSEQETDPLHSTGEQSKENTDNDAQNDGNRTPTMAKSPSSPQKNGSEPAPGSFNRMPEAGSSTASWADVIAAAVDHSDEHVTK